MKRGSNILFVPAYGLKPLNSFEGTGSHARCKRALSLWGSKKYDYIVTSGGGFAYQKAIQTIPAGALMKQWLVKKGIPANKIISETKSSETYTNIHYSLNLLRKKKIKIKSFTVVSLPTHILRIKIILRRNYGIKAVGAPVKHSMSVLEWLLEPVWIVNHLTDKSGNGFLRRMLRRYIKTKRLS